MRKLARGWIGVGEGRSKEFRGGRRPAAALLATAALGGDGGGRCLAVELHGVEEVPFRGSIWTEGHRGRGSTVSSSGGDNGVGGGVFWHWGGLARLGKGRGADCEGGMPLGEAKGGGRARQGGEGVEEEQRRRARGLAVACSPGGLEGWARPARLGTTAARRRVAVLLSWRERQRQGAVRTACALKWRGVSGAARQRGGSEAASARVRARSSGRAGRGKWERERGERKRESTF
ncbi:hypothetical protein PVAP13_5KG557400 [Panicum virgatum]|uniref:Uncharacterized protein n=1 Tax=Panicum virgatum TaxID=38727 RepID=A0A8T0SQE2_PANVG|nr:hypothetical protein PVAP13_5KG557400 [Panicum virgatum]